MCSSFLGGGGGGYIKGVQPFCNNDNVHTCMNISYHFFVPFSKKIIRLSVFSVCLIVIVPETTTSRVSVSTEQVFYFMNLCSLTNSCNICMFPLCQMKTKDSSLMLSGTQSCCEKELLQEKQEKSCQIV